MARFFDFLELGDTVPDFSVESTLGGVAFHDFIDNEWVVLFTLPSTLSAVETTVRAAGAAATP